MTRISLVAGGAKEWAHILRLVDARRPPLPQHDLNLLLDTIAVVLDAERAARAIKIAATKAGDK